MKEKLLLTIILLVTLFCTAASAQKWRSMGEIKLSAGQSRVISGTVKPPEWQSYEIFVDRNEQLTVTLIKGNGAAAFGLTEYFEEQGDPLSLDALLFPDKNLSESDPNFLTDPPTRVYKLKGTGAYNLIIRAGGKTATPYEIQLSFGRKETSSITTAQRSGKYIFDTCSEEKVPIEASSFSLLKGKTYKNSKVQTGAAEGVAHMEIKEVILGDVDGDKNNEGIVWLSCNFGGTGYFDYLAVYKLTEKNAVKIADSEQLQVEGFELNSLKLENSNIVARFLENMRSKSSRRKEQVLVFSVINGRIERETGKHAQKTVNVMFPKGGNSAEIIGQGTVTYLLKIKKGQEIFARVLGRGSNEFVIAFSAPDFEEQNVGNFYQDTAWATQIYSFKVVGNENTLHKFQIQVK